MIRILLIAGLVYFALQQKQESTRNMILIVTGLLAVCMMSREGLEGATCADTTACVSADATNPCLLAGTCVSGTCGPDAFAASTVSCEDTSGAASTCNGAGACTVADPPPPPTSASPCPSTVCSPTPCPSTVCSPPPTCPACPGACTSLPPGADEDTDNCGDDWEWLWKDDSKVARTMCKKNSALWADVYCEQSSS